MKKIGDKGILFVLVILVLIVVGYYGFDFAGRLALDTQPALKPCSAADPDGGCNGVCNSGLNCVTKYDEEGGSRCICEDPEVPCSESWDQGCTGYCIHPNTQCMRDEVPWFGEECKCIPLSSRECPENEYPNCAGKCPPGLKCKAVGSNLLWNGSNPGDCICDDDPGE